MNNSQMITGLRVLALSTQKAVCVELTGVNADAHQLSRGYGEVVSFVHRDTLATLFHYKFVRPSFDDNVVKLRFNSNNYEHFFTLSIAEDETALPFFKRMFAEVKAELRSEPSEGQVKALLNPYNKNFWLIMPSDSPDVAEHDGEFYHAIYSGMFYRIHTSRTECKWVHSDSFNGGAYRAYNGEYYAPEVMAAIYHNAIPFNVEYDHAPEWVAQERYQSVLIDGQTRFINLERPNVAFFSKGIHGYSTRIESIVPPEMLFQKGKTDLYAKRPNDETPFLGWELEACTNESSVPKEEIAKEFKARLPFLVMAKSDSSISPEGFETVSIPATLDFWKETALADTLDAMRVAPYKMRSFKHSSCGFHVHVSRSALSLLDLQKLERFMHNPANRDSLQLLAGRGANTYQNYTDALFNNRKSLAKTENSDSNYHYNMDGITYFNNDGASASTCRRQVTISEARARYGRSGCGLYEILYNYWGDMVSYSTLNAVSNGLFNNCDVRTSGEGYSVKQKALLKKLCEVSPFFRWKFDAFFDSIRDELPSITYTPPTVTVERVGGLVKTSLPLGRKNSYRAARESKGAVGKGMQRYDVLNTKNANTIEFRLFKGTMNPVTVFRYFEFVDGIVRFVASTAATDEGLSFDRFVEWVMKDPFHVTRYENLVAFFVEHKLYKRESIKRRYLPEAKPEDGDLNVTPKPKPEKKEDDNKPLYSLNTLLPVEEIVSATQPTFVIDEEDEDYEEESYDEEESDDYSDPDCSCEDCLRARGEWDDL